MLINKNNIKMFIITLLKEIEGNNIAQHSIDDIIILIENNYSINDKITLHNEIVNNYYQIDPNLRSKSEIALDYNGLSEDITLYEKHLAAIGYNHYLQEKATQFIKNKNEKEFSKTVPSNSLNNIHEQSALSYLVNEYHADSKHIFEINSLSEYIDIVKTLGSEYVSRGHSNLKYHFLPTGHRSVDGVYLTSLDVRNILSEFKRKVIHYNPEFKTKTFWELSAFAQHYGVPTYMLDFTESHLVSLLFSLENLDHENDGLVIFIDYQRFNEQYHSLDSIVDCCDSDYTFSNGKSTETILDEIELPIFLKSDSLNHRIHFQKGVFLLFPQNVDLTSTGNYSNLEVISDFLTLVLIPKELKRDLMEELFNIGMSFESIYPDLDNAVRSIKFKYTIDGREK